jgi:hypothetical protein
MISFAPASTSFWASATFLHRQERTGAALFAGGQRVELGDGGHIGIGGALALQRLPEHFRQAVIGLRADHDADRRGALHDLLALGLRNASGDCDQRLLTRLLACKHYPADVGIDLFGGLFADVAGVEDDEIGVLALRRGGNALLGQQLAHALAVIDVHLAAEALDPVGLGRGGRAGHQARACSAEGSGVQRKGATEAAPYLSMLRPVCLRQPSP